MQLVNRLLGTDSDNALFDVVRGDATTRTSVAQYLRKFGTMPIGAKGDDTTDDAPAIQAAINKGGMIFMPPGLYRCASPLTVTRDAVYFVGAGPRASALRIDHDAGPAI